MGHFGDRIIVVNEVATALFNSGFPPPPNPVTQRWQDLFQAAVICGQYRLEARALELAEEQGCRLVVCDRGLMDGAGYLEGGVEEFCQRFQVIETEALLRYEMVLHLESLATLNPELFVKLLKTNPHRFESPELAQKREWAIRQAWANHPNRVHLADEIEKTASKVLEVLAQYV